MSGGESTVLEELADLPVMLDHAVGIDPQPGLSLGCGLEVGPDIHAGRVEPHEERAAISHRAFYEFRCGPQKLLVDRLHAQPGEGAGVVASLLAPRAEAGIVPRRVGCGRDALENAARAELRQEVDSPGFSGSSSAFR
jgi:hypothetical protein